MAPFLGEIFKYFGGHSEIPIIKKNILGVTSHSLMMESYDWPLQESDSIPKGFGANQIPSFKE